MAARKGVLEALKSGEILLISLARKAAACFTKAGLQNDMAHVLQADAILQKFQRHLSARQKVALKGGAGLFIIWLVAAGHECHLML